MTITWDDFTKVEMRVGRVLEAVDNEGAHKPAYALTIDFGPLGTKRSSAQVADRYEPEDLVGRLVVAVVNFPPKRIASVTSEVLVLGVDGDGGVVLLRPGEDVEPGGRVY